MNYYKNIKFLILDVDGTLTDGKIYMTNEGELFKAFDIKDGYGIKEILPKYNIVPVIITARESKILENRCKELDIEEYHQGCRNKIEKLTQVISEFSKRDKCDYSFSNIAYIGDDILDIQCMIPVKKAGGLVVCPSDAVKAVTNIADFICVNKCGEGAVREFIEWLTAMQTDENANLDKVRDVSRIAYDFIRSFSPSKNADGKYKLENGVFANVTSYITKPLEMTCYEAHRKYIDVQYVIYGTELMTIEYVKRLENNIRLRYDEEKDMALYNYDLGDAKILCQGDVIVLYPENAHRGGISLERSTKVRKIVVKVPFK